MLCPSHQGSSVSATLGFVPLLRLVPVGEGNLTRVRSLVLAIVMTVGSRSWPLIQQVDSCRNAVLVLALRLSS